MTSAPSMSMPIIGIGLPMIGVMNPMSVYVHNELDDMAMLILDDNGMIKDCNMSGMELLGCTLDQLRWQPICAFFPQLKNVDLVQGLSINPHLRFLSHIGHLFEVVGKNGVRFESKLFFSNVEDVDRHCLRIIIRPVLPDYL